MRHIISALLCSLLALQAHAQYRPDRQSLQDEESFSVVVMGDPQGYSRNAYAQPLYDLTTAWIADNVEQLRIKAVLCTGDIVQFSTGSQPRKADQTPEQMWQWASHCFGRLDGRVPYMISGGNKDYIYGNGEPCTTVFHEYFPIWRNSCWDFNVVSIFPNRAGVRDIENMAMELDLPHWGKVLFVSMEFAPRDEVMDWAHDLATSDAYRDDLAILLIHSFWDGEKQRYTDREKYKVGTGNWGQQVWDKFVRLTPNVRLVVCGHVHGRPEDPAMGVDLHTDINDAGLAVHQMLFNTQFLGGGNNDGNGGDGWLRILEFKPDGRTIHASTYSALFGISPQTADMAHRRSEYDEFDIVVR